jgi:hypothetical protein
MSDTVKISESEFAEIKMLQGKFQEMVIEFGHLGIEKLELDRLVTNFVENEKKLKEKWTNLQKLEKDLLDKIVQKYGTGNLNMKDGTFIPTNE